MGENYEEYYEIYSHDYYFIGIVKVTDVNNSTNGCKIQIDIYETDDEFRTEIQNKYKSGEWVPNVKYNSRYDDFNINLNKMTHSRSVEILDRIRPSPCPARIESDRELMYITWVDDMEEVIGYPPAEIGRSKRAIRINIREEIYYFFIY